MNFDLSDDQRAIKSSARDLLGARLRETRVRELAEQGAYDDGLWREVVELGWPGIAVDEGYGGQGLGLVELCVIQEELGYALAPLPYFPTVAAALLLEHAGSEEQRARWLAGLAGGEHTGAVAPTLAGTAPAVADGDRADVIVVLDADGGRVAPTGQLDVEPVAGLDLTRRWAALRGAQDAGEPMPGALAPALDRVHVALAAESLGVAQRLLEMTVAYAMARRQFGHPVGIYQAVQHRCAEMLLDVESTRSAVYFAAWAAEHESESLPLAAATAAASAADAATRVAKSALQLHGGIGFTWEHDLQLFFKRALANAHLLGSAAEHRDRIAALILG